jgi:hypothetical protein
MSFSIAINIGRNSVTAMFRKAAAAQASPLPRMKPVGLPSSGESRQQAQGIQARKDNKWHTTQPAGGFAGGVLDMDKTPELYGEQLKGNFHKNLQNYMYPAAGAAMGGVGAYALAKMFGSSDDEEESRFPWLATLLGAGAGAAGLPAYLAYRGTSPTVRTNSGFQGDIKTTPAPRTTSAVA